MTLLKTRVHIRSVDLSPVPIQRPSRYRLIGSEPITTRTLSRMGHLIDGRNLQTPATPITKAENNVLWDSKSGDLRGCQAAQE